MAFVMKHPLFVFGFCTAWTAMTPLVTAQTTQTAAQAAPIARAASGGCLVAQFKAMALTQSDHILRSQQAQDWLQKNMGRCSPEQLSAIKSNSAAWLGTALTPTLSGLIEGGIEARISGNSALMAQLYESLGKEGVASVETYKNPTPRAPVIRPTEIQGGLAGSVNYGQISGPSTAIINQNSNQSQNIGQNSAPSPQTNAGGGAGMVNMQNAVQQQGQAGRIAPR